MMNRRPAVVVLAAGQGLRFRGDGHKLEQALGPDTVLTRTLKTAIESGLRVIAVTTQELLPLVREVVAARDVVVMPDSDEQGRPAPIGMGYSIAAGVAAAGNAQGWLILPGDMPALQASSINAVAGELARYPVVFAQHRGRRGHPVGFSAELYSELLALQGDEGARRILARYPTHGVELDDPGVRMDVDTVEDLAKMRDLQPNSDVEAG